MSATDLTDAPRTSNDEQATLATTEDKQDLLNRLIRYVSVFLSLEYSANYFLRIHTLLQIQNI